VIARISVLFALIFLLLVPTGADAAGKCEDGGARGPAVAAAREVLRARCDCEGAASAVAYRQCAWGVIQELAASGALPRMCRGRVRQFATRSTCGRDGFIVCCEGPTAAKMRGVLRRAEDGCRLPPRNGGFCVGRFEHLEYACPKGEGCAQSYCGDGILDFHSNEDCEPPGVGLCDPWCQAIVCGNGQIDPGEQCEPPGTTTCSRECRARSCGNGVVEPGTEECEPPGTPTCDAQCYRIRGCGNGLVEAALGEECEPPGTASCDAQCKFVHTCGDGVVEPGEECDGQPGCATDCNLLRSLCCDLGGACVSGAATTDFAAYFNFFKGCGQVLGGSGSYGVCEGTEPCAEPLGSLGCRIGSCSDRPIDPLPLCCDEIDGTCRDTIATTAGAIGGFGCSTFPPPDDGDVPRLKVGTCGPAGRCVPPS
jgi:hypothetical protein